MGPSVTINCQKKSEGGDRWPAILRLGCLCGPVFPSACATPSYIYTLKQKSGLKKPYFPLIQPPTHPIHPPGPGKFISQHFSVNVDQVSSQELEATSFFCHMEEDLISFL
jgi:hypothetical protein